MTDDMDLPNLALAFTRKCLNIPMSSISEERDVIAVLPEFNEGPPGYLDSAELRFTDAHHVLQVVTYWCGQHGLKFQLQYEDEAFVLTISGPGVD